MAAHPPHRLRRRGRAELGLTAVVVAAGLQHRPGASRRSRRRRRGRRVAAVAVRRRDGHRRCGWRTGASPSPRRSSSGSSLRAERLAREGIAAEPDETEFLDLDPYDDEDFEELVRDALDDLPDLLRTLVENHNVAVVISDGGRRRRAYGLYHGDGATRDDVPDRIVIYRDTLRRDFGHDPELLRDAGHDHRAPRAGPPHRVRRARRARPRGSEPSRRSALAASVGAATRARFGEGADEAQSRPRAAWATRQHVTTARWLPSVIACSRATGPRAVAVAGDARPSRSGVAVPSRGSVSSSSCRPTSLSRRGRRRRCARCSALTPSRTDAAARRERAAVRAARRW